MVNFRQQKEKYVMITTWIMEMVVIQVVWLKMDILVQMLNQPFLFVLDSVLIINGKLLILNSAMMETWLIMMDAPQIVLLKMDTSVQQLLINLQFALWNVEIQN